MFIPSLFWFYSIYYSFDWLRMILLIDSQTLYMSLWKFCQALCIVVNRGGMTQIIIHILPTCILPISCHTKVHRWSSDKKLRNKRVYHICCISGLAIWEKSCNKYEKSSNKANSTRFIHCSSMCHQVQPYRQGKCEPHKHPNEINQSESFRFISRTRSDNNDRVFKCDGNCLEDEK